MGAGPWQRAGMQDTTRILGRSGIAVSALGLGCWSIGGEMILDGKAHSYAGPVDDAESIRAIRRAVDLGVTFLDTADTYGTGHAEEVIGRALEGRRQDVVLASKFGYFYNEATHVISGTCTAPDYVERACRASLRRLRTDHLDLYLFHVWTAGVAEIPPMLEALERLVDKGMIRAYGWSTDQVGGARLFAEGRRCAAIEHTLNLFADAPAMLDLCARQQLASIARSPLAMGLLSGKHGAGSTFPPDDVRGAGFPYLAHWFRDGRPAPEILEKLAAVREILTSGGRTLVQGALGWIWARSPATVPIPGFRSVEQVEDSAGALRHGPLTPAQVDEIARLLA